LSLQFFASISYLSTVVLVGVPQGLKIISTDCFQMNFKIVIKVGDLANGFIVILEIDENILMEWEWMRSG
jgi:hypothetical protein